MKNNAINLELARARRTLPQGWTVEGRKGRLFVSGFDTSFTVDSSADAMRAIHRVQTGRTP